MQKRLKPSQKEKKRYLSISQTTKASTGTGRIKSSIEKSILDYLGILGYAKAGIMFVNKQGKLVLAVNRQSLEDIKAALALSKIQVIRVSGTIKGLKK